VSFGSFPNLSEYKKTDDAEGPSSSIELTNLNSSSIGEPKTQIEKDPFYKYYWHNSGFLAEFIKTAEFIVLVGIFEYFFFISIVDKFKIANSKTILCDVAKKII
jgi:ABC-type bacteriocin/lantibiotic exporter with double-glycine peptidase domain